ncbi:zinc-ribbon domain-containing protein [Phaeobacter sp. PT47_59]|uniref:zinc-ribbon domain-containing protein n=1 Tax=Phaeobacter sp. PT47_59 TaxID=3029979 RepID=UPI0023801EBB|nr:zinc-ribbon domain-containing protein [Phaeobacter sp. PT47_59]MDE4174773.1 zinc-ribbon domain-containing protein [Phaeobacter sp. PT47_59]
MRLTCPNCAAQYEVPDDVIPEEGRDVQCSNCGTTWFEPGAGAPPASHDASHDVGDDAGDDAEGNLTPHEAEEEISASPHPEEADHAEEPEEAPVAEPAAPRTQRGLDPALSDILREEAEREASLRAAAASSEGLESQPNLGLDDLPESESALRARQAKDRMARLQGQDPRQLAAEESGQRRDILPDIEEINSTLRASDGVAAAQPAAETPVAPRKGGFARGFSLTILLFLVLLMVYTNAAKIAETVPQADPYLSTYVTWVDQARLWLDAKVKALQAP